MFYLSRIGGKEFLYNNGTIKLDAKPIRKDKVGTSILLSELMVHTFKTSTKSSDDEIKTLAEIKIFDEYGLDPASEYKITIVKKELKFEKAFLVEVFFVDTEKLKIRLDDIIVKYKNIDYLAIPFLAYNILYSKNKIDSLSNDLFLYFGFNEAYLTIYRDGKYIAHKALSSFEDLAANFNSTHSNKIDSSKLRSIFLNKGFKKDNYDETEQEIYTFILNKMISIYEKVNSILLYNRNIYGLESIDKVFINYGSDIAGLKDFLESINFEYTIHNTPDMGEDTPITKLNTILAAYIEDQLSSKNNEFNLTVYKRTPPFYRQPLGILLIGSILSSLIYYLYVDYEEENISKLNETLGLLKTQNKSKVVIVKRLKKESQNLDKRISSIKFNLKRYNKIDIVLKNSLKKYNELTKTDQKIFILLRNITDILEKNSLSVSSFKLEDNVVLMDVISLNKKRDFLAQFIKDLINKDYRNSTIQSVVKEDFEYNDKYGKKQVIPDLYKGSIRIEL